MLLDQKFVKNVNFNAKHATIIQHVLDVQMSQRTFSISRLENANYI